MNECGDWVLVDGGGGEYKRGVMTGEREGGFACATLWTYIGVVARDSGNTVCAEHFFLCGDIATTMDAARRK